jgi:phage recombination protein Bet
MAHEITRREPGPPGPDRERLDLLKRNHAPHATDREFEYFASTAELLKLAPQAAQIYAVSRKNRQTGAYEMTVQLGVQGLRLIAERTGEYAGTEEPLWCGPDGQWTDVWLNDAPPVACKVRVWRKDARVPTTHTAMYREFRQETNPLWRTMPAHMLAIAAERHALRKAFQFDVEAHERALAEAEFTIDALPGEDAAPAAQLPPAEMRQLTAPARQSPAASSPRLTSGEPEAPAPPPRGALAGGAPAARPAATPPEALEPAAPLAPREPDGAPAAAEPPEITGFFATMADQLRLSRADVKHRLGVADIADDVEAINQALTERKFTGTRRQRVAALIEQLATEIDQELRDAAVAADAGPPAF